MAIRIYKPTTPGRRNASVNLHVEVTKRSPEKSLLAPLSKTGGRNNQGKKTVRGRGGGHKRRYRRIDFRRTKDDMAATVVGIEYDPNRSCHIALLKYEYGTMRYILAPKNVTDGEVLLSSSDMVEPKPGNCMPVKHIPTGIMLHCIELEPGRGGKLCRSAGIGGRLTNKEGRWATIVIPSGEIRQVSMDCRATVGVLGNSDHGNVKLGKAGRRRHLGRRPHVRGTAMNPVDHPMGGGEGRTAGGRHPCSPTAVLAKGGRTRRRNHPTDVFIIRRRRKRK